MEEDLNNAEDFEDVLTPPRICEIVQTVRDYALPSRSKKKYKNAYLDFGKWKKKENTAVTSENVLIAYFKELSEKFRPTTLWATYSMLKSTIHQKENTIIETFKSLIVFLKRKAEGYVPKKAKVLKTTEVEKFLKEAPNNQYLATKVRKLRV